VQEFIRHFRRLSKGRWECVESATLTLPTGRVEVTPGSRFVVGTRYMGIDLALMLEEERGRHSGA
jgi:hypothetical protein